MLAGTKGSTKSSEFIPFMNRREDSLLSPTSITSKTLFLLFFFSSFPKLTWSFSILSFKVPSKESLKVTVTRRLEKEILKQSPTGIGKTGIQKDPERWRYFKKSHLLPNHKACLKWKKMRAWQGWRCRVRAAVTPYPCPSQPFAVKPVQRALPSATSLPKPSPYTSL